MQNRFESMKEDALNAIHKRIDGNDKFIDLLLKHKKIHDNCRSDKKLLEFHAACTLKNSSVADNLLDQFSDIEKTIRKHSPIYPGYTALHFAAHCNAKIVEMLLRKGANLLTQDAEGVTPLDICIKSFEVEEVLSILSLVSAWKNILFSDGKTKLMDYVSSLRDPGDHKNFLQQIGKDIGISLSKNSPLWPGCTILHVAVILLPECNREMLNDILTVSTDLITTQDSHSSTPVHLAFRLNRLKILKLILEHHQQAENPLDKHSLSHLHIMASVEKETAIENILKKETNLNIVYRGRPLATVKPGWTPLHTAAYTNNTVVASFLLKQGANLLQTDSRGFTAIHLLLGAHTEQTAKSLFSLNSSHSVTVINVVDILFESDQLRECIVEGVGLTHLHVAALKNKSEAIERLLELGSDIEATIGKLEDEDLKKFEGCRPIHLALMGDYLFDAYQVLLTRGADILAKKLNGSSALFEVLTGKYDYRYLIPTVEFIWSSAEQQKRIERKSGITMLHLACCIFDEEKIKELLKKQVDVNARTHDDSSIWPGFTPLHVLVLADSNSNAKEIVDKLCRLLLENGAHVTLANADGDTPMLMTFKAPYICNGDFRARFFMSYQRDFNVNPTNKSGMSHFHAVCLLDKVESAKKFLKKNDHIDVNQAVNSFDNSRFAGHTPLLLALTTRAIKSYYIGPQIQMVNLLFEYDADVHAADAFGYTPLHKLCSCTPAMRKKLMDQILIDDEDINKRAVDGKTPLEILLWEKASQEEIQYLVECGAKINTYNPISDVGYMAIVLKNYKRPDNILEMMMNLPHFAQVRDTGRNAIHNAVAVESSNTRIDGYAHLLDKLIALGCKIFQQDAHGRTALHLAVKFQNEEAVSWLLSCGADVNIVDSAGKSPFSYVSKHRRDEVRWTPRDTNASVCKILAIHLLKLQIIGLQVSELNARLLKMVLRNRNDIKVESSANVTKVELENAAKVKMCQRGFTLRDFLHETGVVALYSFLSQADRDAVDSFFKSPTPLGLFELKSFLNLQYKNALERSSLIKPAINGLRSLLGFPLPILCADIVLSYLTNFDVKNMTAATIITDYTSMTVD